MIKKLPIKAECRVKEGPKVCQASIQRADGKVDRRGGPKQKTKATNKISMVKVKEE
jgi:hypothetical protein